MIKLLLRTMNFISLLVVVDTIIIMIRISPPPCCILGLFFVPFSFPPLLCGCRPKTAVRGIRGTIHQLPVNTKYICCITQNTFAASYKIHLIHQRKYISSIIQNTFAISYKKHLLHSMKYLCSIIQNTLGNNTSVAG